GFLFHGAVQEKECGIVVVCGEARRRGAGPDQRIVWIALSGLLVELGKQARLFRRALRRWNPGAQEIGGEQQRSGARRKVLGDSDELAVDGEGIGPVGELQTLLTEASSLTPGADLRAEAGCCESA